jgi:hypothetical protein
LAKEGLLNGCWEFGQRGGNRLGVLLWCWGEGHVYVLRGADASAFGLSHSGLPHGVAPWFFSVVAGRGGEGRSGRGRRADFATRFSAQSAREYGERGNEAQAAMRASASSTPTVDTGSQEVEEVPPRRCSSRLRSLGADAQIGTGCMVPDPSEIGTQAVGATSEMTPGDDALVDVPPGAGHIPGLDDSGDDGSGCTYGSGCTGDDGFVSDVEQMLPALSDVEQMLPASRASRFGRRKPRDVWKRFTPSKIDASKCMARTWGLKGCGSQCTQKPVAGKTLCNRHAADSLPHGLVTGPIPFGKLQQFLAAERRRLLNMREHADVVAVARGEQEAGETGAKKRRGVVGKVRPQQRWYTRAMMWEMARKLNTEDRRREHGELRGLSDLQDSEYNECLEKVNSYFVANRPLRRCGARVLLKPDMGPRSSAERGTELEDYNGEGGGRIFKWYARVMFECELRALGVGRGTMTEALCMRALRATSVRLRQLSEVTKSLKEYAGPQCFPHCADRGRWRKKDY